MPVPYSVVVPLKYLPFKFADEQFEYHQAAWNVLAQFFGHVS